MNESILVAAFWICAGAVIYAYLGYPLAVRAWVFARGEAIPTRASATVSEGELRRSVSVVLTVHDEADRIRTRLDELAALVTAWQYSGEVIVVTDGCTDGTAAAARAHPSALVRVVELVQRAGKAHALSRGCAVARGDILVFADARQHWATDAISRLVDNFTCPEVGAVSGELVLAPAAGVLAGVGLYWRYEKWLRSNEARLHSTVGVSGAIAAVRRELFIPIPKGILIDDLYWPLQVVMRGHRVAYDPRAVAYDRLPDNARSEFRRKVRTLSGNFQLMVALPRALLPWTNPIWVQFMSHKVLRLFVPWLLMGLLLTSALLSGPFFRLAFWAQVGFYSLAAFGLKAGTGSQSRLLAFASSFIVLNAAAWLAFWVFILGGAGVAWRKASYDRAARHD